VFILPDRKIATQTGLESVRRNHAHLTLHCGRRTRRKTRQIRGAAAQCQARRARIFPPIAVRVL
jgi:hypothetical protein